MNQSELHRQVAKQLGESHGEIARRGFSLVDEEPDDATSSPIPEDDAAATVAAA